MNLNTFKEYNNPETNNISTDINLLSNLSTQKNNNNNIKTPSTLIIPKDSNIYLSKKNISLYQNKINKNTPTLTETNNIYVTNSDLSNLVQDIKDQKKISSYNTNPINNILKTLGYNFKLETYFGNELSTLSNEKITQIATCYKDVFNESWGESWTIETAKQEILDSFKITDYRLPVASLLTTKSKVIGFAWTLLLNKEHLIKERDMPFNLCREKKNIGMQISKYWLENVVKTDKVLLFRELGTLKEFRKDLSPFLCLPLFEQALSYQYKSSLYWTNLHSKAFKWGLGIGWSPLHYFIENDLILMTGNLTKAAQALHNLAFNKTRSSQKELINNINHYLCK